MILRMSRSQRDGIGGPFLQFGLAPAEEGYESSGDPPRGYATIVYLRENACQAFFVWLIVIFGICVVEAGADWVRQ